MNSVQSKVRAFAAEYDLSSDAQERLHWLVSEVGELSKELLKATDYGRQGFQRTASWRDELGDVLFDLVCLANATGVNLEEALETVLQKYRERFETTGKIGSGR